MGNEKSIPQNNKHQLEPSSTPRKDPKIVKAFHRLTTDGLTFNNLKDAFETDLAESLWDFLSEKRAREGESLALEEFSKNTYSILGEIKSNYPCKIHLIKVCSEAAGVTAFQGDEVFIASLEEELIKP